MTSSSRPSFVHRMSTGTLLCLSTLALSSCGVLASDPVEEAIYAAATEMPEGTIELQNWIPRTATDVRIKFTTTAQARPVAGFTLPEENELPESCEQVSASPPEPQLDADWVPEGAAEKATLMCGDFAVVVQGRTITAWDIRAPEWDGEGSGRP